MRGIRASLGRAFSSVKASERLPSTVGGSESLSAKSSTFRRLVSDRLSLSSYAVLEDDFRRLSRSSKVVFIGLGSFLAVPGSFSLLTTPSSIVEDLVAHQFKLSSAALSWLSATTLTFHLVRFNRSPFSVALTLVGLLGPCASLIVAEHSEAYGYACLLTSYLIFGLGVNPYRMPFLRQSAQRFKQDYDGRFAGNGRWQRSPVLPVSVAKPVVWTVWLNVVLLALTAWRGSFARSELETTSPEEIIRRYEAIHGRPAAPPPPHENA